VSAEEIANVTLLSANKDINDDRFDDFVGVRPLFGHGKADLQRALALTGAL
jgi:hypothetical protein